jgi:hypothetical protein
VSELTDDWRCWKCGARIRQGSLGVDRLHGRANEVVALLVSRSGLLGSELLSVCGEQISGLNRLHPLCVDWSEIGLGGPEPVGRKVEVQVAVDGQVRGKLSVE